MKSIANEIADTRRALTYGYLLEKLILWFFVADHLDLTKISLLSESSSPGSVSHSLVALGLADQTPMHPQSCRIQSLPLGMVDQVVKSPDEYLGDFSV